MKNLFIITILFVLLIVSGCAKQGLSQSELFDKKQECISHKDKMPELFQDLSFGDNARIDEIFYSKKGNSCYFIVTGNKGRFLFDYFAQKLVTADMLLSMMTDDCQKDQECRQILYDAQKKYEDTVQELKGE